MSLAVVINGPVASAGSIFRFSSIKGMKAPNKAAKTMTHNKDMPTVVLSAFSNPNRRVIMKISTEHITPLTSPTLSSFISLAVMLDVLMLEVAKPCTTIADG